MGRRALGAILLTCALLLAACSGDAEPGPRADEPTKDAVAEPGSKRDRGKGSGPRESGPGKKKDSGDKDGDGPGRSSGDTNPGPGSSDGEPASDDGADGPVQVASASATRSDPSGDPERQGETPRYADLRRATIAGLGDSVRFAIRVDGSIPRGGTGEGVDMTASFHFRMRGGDEHQIYAIGSRSGWKADFDNSGEFPGTFTLEDDRIVFELDWDRLGGPSAFKWLAQTSWTRSADGPLDDTKFAFDQVPEYEKASYPE